MIINGLSVSIIISSKLTGTLDSSQGRWRDLSFGLLLFAQEENSLGEAGARALKDNSFFMTQEFQNMEKLRQAQASIIP